MGSMFPRAPKLPKGGRRAIMAKMTKSKPAKYGSQQFTGIDPYKRTSGMDVASRNRTGAGGRRGRGRVRRRGRDGPQLGPQPVM